MISKPLATALVAVFMSGSVLAHSPDKVRKNAEKQRAEQQARCDKFLAQSGEELDKSSAIIQAMLQRCQKQYKDNAAREGNNDHSHH